MSEHKKSNLSDIVPNDGTYLGTKKAKQLRDKKLKENFNKAWIAQKELLKDCTVKLYKDKTNIGVQWQSFIDYEGNPLIKPMRVKRSLNSLGRGKFPHTANAVNNAIVIAQEIDLKIKAGSFSWQDYLQWLPKELRPKDAQPEKPKTIAEWVEEYEQDYWNKKSQDKNSKQYYRDEKYWNKGVLFFLRKIPDWEQPPSKELFDEACRNYPRSRKRNDCCSVINVFAKFCGLTDYNNFQYRLKKHQIEVKTKKPKRNLSEVEIEVWRDKFSDWNEDGGKPNEWRLWQWVYGMQATYGFRNHETLNIFNLNDEYLGEDGRLYPPFTDSIKNPRGIIYTEGKGVERAAFLPQPLRWLEQFKLREIPSEYYHFMKSIENITGYQQAKAKDSKIRTYEHFLYRHGFTFTAYNLRHAYNIKAHNLGIPVNLIAKNLGHTVLQNTTTYLESQGLKNALDAIDDWEKKQVKANADELSLEEQIKLLRQENEQLKAILQSLLESMKTTEE